MFTQLKSRTFLWIALISLFALGGLGFRYVRDNTPVSTTGTDVPDPKRSGNPDQAMEHTRKLLEKFRRNNWQYDLQKIPFSEWTLPDKHLFEWADMRRANVSSYAVPDPMLHPEYAPIAFYTDLYARRNVSQYRGGKARSRPDGYFIVAYKNGEVKQVSVWDVRLIRSANGDYVTGFPGMPGYDPNGPRLPWVQAAAPPDPAPLAALSRIAGKPSASNSGIPCDSTPR